MSVLTYVRAIAPEFAATADDTVDTLTDLVSEDLDAATFGSKMTMACARLVAHELTLQARAAQHDGVGALTSVRTGDLSASYAGAGAPGSPVDEALRQTTHGLAFLQIRNSRSDVSFGYLT